MTAKAANYLDQLDRARCEGNWSAVPELVRKVRKHAPERACLTLAAETECAISNATIAVTATSSVRPRTADEATDAKNLEASDKLPKLLETIEKEDHYTEDKFQAQVCVGWLHWVIAEYGLALTRLPQSLDHHEPQLDAPENLSEWTIVCALKSAYLKANCLTRRHNRNEALDAFRSGLPALSRVWSGFGVRKQLTYWAELFLTEFCMLQSEALREDDASLQDANSLACYRSWTKYWEAIAASAAGGYGFKGSVPRRRVWKEYYIALSRIVEEDLPFPSGYVGKITNDMSARAQLRQELKMVEATYQGLLLGETAFPRADDEREEVEEFVKLVVQNASILCGRGWREQDLGPDGRNGFSRGVLDTLYAAATKTYHSTSILRSLFLVHFSVAEFDLAFKAFDSYMDIMKKGKARVDKTGHLEPELDDDGTALETMSQAVVALCQFGHAQVAEKARQLGAELEDWLAKLPQLKTVENGAPTATDDAGQQELIHPPVAPHIVALSWQAIGLAHAHWSRVTHEASLRTEIQGRAIRCLRRSLATDLGRSKDIRSFFALALLLAERRQLTDAIDVVKTALVASRASEDHYHLLYGPYWLERSLISMWHLLALLLSARQDYVSAARACEGAMEQFRDPAVLFGKEDSGFRSEHLNDMENKDSEKEAHKGLVDDMDDDEKQSILEVKMTQLALVELVEGPEIAVNASYELLTLFSRLFGNIAAQPSALKPPQAVEPPKTSGTLRSIRGSIFGGGRDRSRPPTRQHSQATTMSGRNSTLPVRPATAQTVSGAAPAIQVTAENGTPPSRRGSLGQRHRSQSRPRNSLKKRDRSASQHRAASTTTNTVVDGEPFFTPATEPEQSDFFTYSSKRQPSMVSSNSHGRGLPTFNSYLSTSTEYSELSAERTHATTHLLPLIQYPKEKERMTRSAILIRVWLMIAGFYRRAGMLEDCKGAASEAQKLVHTLETESNRDPSGSSASRAVGWAESKSIEDLWGDVHTEFGHLALEHEDFEKARSEFESALTHSPDHPSATVGLSNILLDTYSQKLRPLPPIPLVESEPPSSADIPFINVLEKPKSIPVQALGLAPTPAPAAGDIPDPEPMAGDHLPEPYKAANLPLVDRLAARDRAYALLSGLTRLGSGWNLSEAWFALARAHEESGQPDKAKEVLWWCIELEEAAGVRDWRCLAGGGYVL